jgi:hypothetical protein
MGGFVFLWRRHLLGSIEPPIEQKDLKLNEPINWIQKFKCFTYSNKQCREYFTCGFFIYSQRDVPNHCKDNVNSNEGEKKGKSTCTDKKNRFTQSLDNIFYV